MTAQPPRRARVQAYHYPQTRLTYSFPLAVILQERCHPEPTLHCEVYLLQKFLLLNGRSMARVGSP